MLKISLLSVFPSLHETFLKTSLIGRAVDRGLVSFSSYSFSDFCNSGERIDAATVGAGPGMLIKPVLVEKVITAIEAEHGPAFRIFFSPQGEVLSQKYLKELASIVTNVNQNDESLFKDPALKELAEHKHILLISSRYEGMDRRVEQEYAHSILSVGDYVLMGSEVVANLFLEGLLRLIPDVVDNAQSIKEESFENGILDYPSYALPVDWRGRLVPDILRSGNHKAIAQFRTKEALKRTVLERFDLLKKEPLSPDLVDLAHEQIPGHYVVLMHGEIVVKNGDVGVTSIGSLNLHDICRAAKTYGIKKVFIVTPMEDQHMIMKTFLDFWQGAAGRKYNAQRANALDLLQPAYSFAQVRDQVQELEGKKPLILTTSAKKSDSAPAITFFDQKKVWQQERPVMLLFGTGQGLAPHIMAESDFILRPVKGLTTFNHLSVRSAIAIILDRWLGV